MKIYMAGKIGKNDWRHEIFKDLRNSDYDNLYEMRSRGAKFNPPNRDGYTYSGPYFIGDDHGGCHGNGTHGRLAGAKESFILPDLKVDSKNAVFKKCQRWISDSEAVFVWLDSADAFGTLVEIGYASHAEKPIYLFISSQLEKTSTGNDLWFAKEAAVTVRTADNANLAWENFRMIVEKREPVEMSPLFQTSASSKQKEYILSLLEKNKKVLLMPLSLVNSGQAGAFISHLVHGAQLKEPNKDLIRDGTEDELNKQAEMNKRNRLYGASEVVKLVKQSINDERKPFTSKHHQFMEEYIQDCDYQFEVDFNEFVNYDSGYPKYAYEWIEFLVKSLKQENKYFDFFPTVEKKKKKKKKKEKSVGAKK